MEKSANIHTAQDLYEFLKTIPEGHRQVLPLDFIDGEGQEGYYIKQAEAFRYFDSEGNEERGFRLSGDKS